MRSMIMLTTSRTAMLFTALALSALCSCGEANEEISRTPEPASAADERTDATLQVPEPEPENLSASPSPRDATIAEAMNLLAEVGETYRAAPTLLDEIVLQIGGETQVMRVRFDQGNRAAEMTLPTASAVLVDDTLYVTRDSMYDVYLQMQATGDLGQMVSEVLGWVPSYHFAMRRGDEPPAYLEGLGLGMLSAPRVRGHTLAEDGEQPMHAIMLESRDGQATVRIDPETKLIMSIDMELFPSPGQPADAPPIRASLEMNPVLGDALAEALVFEPGDREAVEDPQDIQPRPLRAGDRAPNFELETLGGERVELRELRGQVVVLDFWATWCKPCIFGLPYVDRFAAWAQENDQPVRVFAVNTMETAATTEERRAAAAGFWESQNFTMQTLLDLESKVVSRYGYTTIPMTLVIGPDGNIFRVHEGFSRNIYQILKSDAERALRTVAEGEAG